MILAVGVILCALEFPFPGAFLIFLSLLMGMLAAGERAGGMAAAAQILHNSKRPE